LRSHTIMTTSAIQDYLTTIPACRACHCEGCYAY